MATGKVAQVIGTVVDVEFPPDQLPNIFDALNLDNGGENLVLEVQQHIGNNWVRCLALGSTDGLARGVDVDEVCDAVTVGVEGGRCGPVWRDRYNARARAVWGYQEAYQAVLVDEPSRSQVAERIRL